MQWFRRSVRRSVAGTMFPCVYRAQLPQLRDTRHLLCLPSLCYTATHLCISFLAPVPASSLHKFLPSGKHGGPRDSCACCRPSPQQVVFGAQVSYDAKEPQARTLGRPRAQEESSCHRAVSAHLQLPGANAAPRPSRQPDEGCDADREYSYQPTVSTEVSIRPVEPEEELA